MKYLIILLSLLNISLFAQVLPKTEIKDKELTTHLRTYIAECRLLNLIKDSTGIVVLQHNRQLNGHQLLLSLIDKERHSYFTTRCVPSQYAYFDGVLVLIRSGVENKLQFSKAYYEEIDKIVEGKFQRLEEERGLIVVYEKTPDGKVHRTRQATGGNVHNDVRIEVSADGQSKLYRDI
ncbi:hypothetical protein [Spirosoma oryzicola]|uniref:hypothetical protein n=1 Tax=Spirosoma oryzicola TaxID=2898794 RepID=UPI001E45CDA3|nr:hypothetical protein [Spirosoma oryzicola]UHG93554.1 hypothetical protein LQ777_11745 [Spirosoma oryzicola]